MRAGEKKYDVLVVGAGVAGVAAALEASRSGLNTGLVEKGVLLGGLATSGIVPIYMPLCDGSGRQVTAGIAQELLEASMAYGPGHCPAGWLGKDHEEPDARFRELYPEGDLVNRYAVIYAPHAFVWGLDHLLEASDVELWLDTRACAPIMNGTSIAGVEVENKSGRIAIRASLVIDATGDADIAHRASAPCAESESYPSLLYQYTSLALARRAVEERSAERMVAFRSAGADEFGAGYQGVEGPFRATDGEDVSRFVMASRRIARREMAADQRAEGGPGRENMYPVTLPAIAQFRMSRRIIGRETLRTKHVNRRRENSVGLIADCRRTDAVWEVPYGALLPRTVENLLAVGRCVSAEGYAWQVMRLIPAAALTGQVAGISSALALRTGSPPGQVDPETMQRAARSHGWALHV